jgi:peptidyl-prolyl cis-trans isomerase C
MTTYFRPVSRAVLICLALTATTDATLAQTVSKAPVARVDGAVITEFDLGLAIEDLGGTPESQNKDALIGYLADLQIGAKAAADAKMADTDEFKARLEHARRKLLLEQYLNAESKKAVTPEAIKKLYDETVKSLPPEEEARARHILVPTEDEAKAVEARLAKGEDFAKVAADVSKDPGSAKEGGDLGYFTKDRMVPEFAEAAFKLEPGKVSDPVKSQFGWHVIKLEDKRQRPAPDLDSVKDQIAQYLERKSQQDLILGLRSKAKIERLDQAEKKDEPKKP